MQFVAFEPGIYVNASTVSSIIHGMGRYTIYSRHYLSQVNIGRVVGGKLVLDMEEYPQEAWLKAFENIAAHMNEGVLFNIGTKIPKTAIFPEWPKDIYAAVESVDVAYHINHSKDGVPLYDVKTNVMREGIGHYGCEYVRGRREITSVCKNPYPCAFDRGILAEVTRRFDPKAKVVHDDSCECRKNGADSCTYRITW
jgi:predicted hydrocarbon binding protein